MQNRVEIKAEAKRLVRSGKTSPLLVTMIVLAIQAVLERVVNLVTYGTGASPTSSPFWRPWRPPVL